ncbi:hypothetical protein Sjap_002441 [Stephania japonica]|uniref:Uncharacterized protein n=1 Tax=Stephania japonica TaxID=461633 RepID=A0AAP0PW43_9MAGN
MPPTQIPLLRDRWPRVLNSRPTIYLIDRGVVAGVPRHQILLDPVLIVLEFGVHIPHSSPLLLILSDSFSCYFLSFSNVLLLTSMICNHFIYISLFKCGLLFFWVLLIGIVINFLAWMAECRPFYEPLEG